MRAPLAANFRGKGGGSARTEKGDAVCQAGHLCPVLNRFDSARGQLSPVIEPIVLCADRCVFTRWLKRHNQL